MRGPLPTSAVVEKVHVFFDVLDTPDSLLDLFLFPLQCLYDPEYIFQFFLLISMQCDTETENKVY